MRGLWFGLGLIFLLASAILATLNAWHLDFPLMALNVLCLFVVATVLDHDLEHPDGPETPRT